MIDDCAKPPAIVAKAHAPSPAVGAVYRALHPKPKPIVENCNRFEASAPIEPIALQSFERMSHVELEPPVVSLSVPDLYTVPTVPSNEDAEPTAYAGSTYPSFGGGGVVFPIYVPIAPTPEPEIWVCLLLGGVWVWRRRAITCSGG